MAASLTHFILNCGEIGCFKKPERVPNEHNSITIHIFLEVNFELKINN